MNYFNIYIVEGKNLDFQKSSPYNHVSAWLIIGECSEFQIDKTEKPIREFDT